MAKVRGVGIAAVNYPTGMNLGGDPSQALIHSTTTGNFVISLSSTDLGQGLKTVIAQIGAEALGVPFENVMIDTADTDTGPHCMGTFASRATHRVGNAVIQAAQEARKVMLEVAADELEANPDDLETDGQGHVRVKGSPDRSIHLVDLALAAHFKYGKTISGRGMYIKPKSEVDPETGKMDPDSTEAHGRGDGVEPEERLRGGARGQPGAGRRADPRRLADGHGPRAVRDDPALLSGGRSYAGRLQ
jgi:CO/xanthine dehydrogenase Mo-binding subunit